MAAQRQPPHVYSATAFRRPQVAVEVVVFVVRQGRLGVVLVPSNEFSTAPRWALPAAVIEDQPTLDDAIGDVIRPLLGEEVAKKRQVQTFDRLADSRGRLIEIAWLTATRIEALLDATTEHTIGFPTPDPDALEVRDRSGHELHLSTGQTETVSAAIERLRESVDTDGVEFDFLPDEFTLRDLHTVHEAVLGTSINYDSFRRRILTSGVVDPSGRLEQNVSHRPAELYRVRRR